MKGAWRTLGTQPSEAKSGQKGGWKRQILTQTSTTPNTHTAIRGRHSNRAQY